MKRVLMGLVLTGMLSGGALMANAQDWRYRDGNVRRDAADRRQDYRDIRRDQAEIARDRWELRRDMRQGNYRGAAEERGELRSEYRDLQQDRRDIRRDNRDIRRDWNWRR